MAKKEEYAYVLDIIPPDQILLKEPSLVRKGFPLNETYVQAIGDMYFTLLELTVKPNVDNAEPIQYKMFYQYPCPQPYFLFHVPRFHPCLPHRYCRFFDTLMER